MLAEVELARLRISQATPAAHKAALGQYVTPASVARFMAQWLEVDGAPCRLLDAGAGVGSLASAFLARCAQSAVRPSSIHVSAYEKDERLLPDLRTTLERHAATLPLHAQVLNDDFLEAAVRALPCQAGSRYTHAILNPPYKKSATPRVSGNGCGWPESRRSTSTAGLSPWRWRCWSLGGGWWPSCRAAFATGRMTGPFALTCCGTQRSRTCICSIRAPRRSKATACCKRT